MSGAEANKAIAFDVILDDTNKSKSAKLRRLQQIVNKHHFCAETMEEKLAKGEKRRQVTTSYNYRN